MKKYLQGKASIYFWELKKKNHHYITSLPLQNTLHYVQYLRYLCFCIAPVSCCFNAGFPTVLQIAAPHLDLCHAIICPPRRLIIPPPLPCAERQTDR